MAENIIVKFYNLETGREIPMSQQEEDATKKKWWKKLGGWLIGTGGAIIVGIFYGYGVGGGPFGVQRVTITAITRPDPNK